MHAFTAEGQQVEFRKATRSWSNPSWCEARQKLHEMSDESCRRGTRTWWLERFIKGAKCTIAERVSQMEAFYWFVRYHIDVPSELLEDMQAAPDWRDHAEETNVR